MYDRSKLRAELVADECVGGIIPIDAYLDSEGFWTIGIGHLLHNVKITEPRVRRITMAEALAWFWMDVEIAEGALDRVLPGWSNLSNTRQRALVNMAFNRGEGRLAKSTSIVPAIKAAMLASSAPAAWEPVRTAIKNSEWGQQLKNRSGRIADALVTGVA